MQRLKVYFVYLFAAKHGYIVHYFLDVLRNSRCSRRPRSQGPPTCGRQPQERTGGFQIDEPQNCRHPGENRPPFRRR